MAMLHALAVALLASAPYVNSSELDASCTAKGEMHWEVPGEDGTALLQVDTTLAQRSPGSDNEGGAQNAGLMQVLEGKPPFDITAQIGQPLALRLICDKLANWTQPLASWLNTSLSMSSESMDELFTKSLEVQKRLLMGLRNETDTASQRFAAFEALVNSSFMFAGPAEAIIEHALLPLKDSLDNVKLPSVSNGTNDTFYNLMVSGIMKKARTEAMTGFKNLTEQSASELLKELDSTLDAGMAQAGTYVSLVNETFRSIMGSLSLKMSERIPLLCSAVWTVPLGNANVTVDGMVKKAQGSMEQLALGIREGAQLVASIVAPNLKP